MLWIRTALRIRAISPFTKGHTMRATPREHEAATSLANALLEFLLAREEASSARKGSKPREAIRVHVEQPAPQREPSRPAPTAVEPKLPDKLLVDSKEAAKLLSVGSRTLWTMTAPRGPIPSVRLGRAVRYKLSSLEEFIRKSEKARR